MQNMLRILRYVVLAFIVVCNSIIASVAVWNQSVSPSSVSVYAIDICATCLAVLGLLLSFAILFLELAGQDSVTGKVWFECTWVSALFIVNLVVVSVASAVLVVQSCIPGFIDACTSTQTLLSFSWTITIVLLIYAITLFTSIYLLRREHPDIWSTHVNQFPTLGPKHKLPSEPSTPVFTTFTNIPRIPSLIAPVPRPFRTFPFVDDLYQHHSRRDSEYEIEPQVHPAPRPIQRLPTLSKDNHWPAPSFYPQFIQGALQSDPEAQRPLSAPERQRTSVRRMPSPPPLANWPRHDVLSQPVKSKRAKITLVLDTTLIRNVSRHSLGPVEMPPSLEEGGP